MVSTDQYHGKVATQFKVMAKWLLIIAQSRIFCVSAEGISLSSLRVVAIAM